MSPAAKALRQLRAAKVTAVECKVTPKGKLTTKATVEVGKRTVTVDKLANRSTITGGRIVTLKGRMHISSILEEPMPPEANVSPAAKKESDRLQTELWALLRANPTYAQHRERQRASQGARSRKLQATNLADSAVTDGVSKAELLKLVEEAWEFSTIAHVMKS